MIDWKVASSLDGFWGVIDVEIMIKLWSQVNYSGSAALLAQQCRTSVPNLAVFVALV